MASETIRLPMASSPMGAALIRPIIESVSTSAAAASHRSERYLRRAPVPFAALRLQLMDARRLAGALPQRRLEVGRPVVLAQQVPERLVGQLLKIHHPVAREEIERVPRLVVELDALAGHGGSGFRR